MAELWTVNKKRELCQAELAELDHCLQQNATYVWNLVQLQNLSYMAATVHDTDWLHEICRDIDDLTDDPHAAKIKKP
ncbi:hypothetical protein D3C84_1089290 [compost metagenome]